MRLAARRAPAAAAAVAFTLAAVVCLQVPLSRGRGRSVEEHGSLAKSQAVHLRSVARQPLDVDDVPRRTNALLDNAGVTVFDECKGSCFTIPSPSTCAVPTETVTTTQTSVTGTSTTPTTSGSTTTTTTTTSSSTSTRTRTSLTATSTTTTSCPELCVYTCVDFGKPTFWCGDVCALECGSTTTRSVTTATGTTATVTTATHTTTTTTFCSYSCVYTCMDVGNPTPWCGDICGYDNCEQTSVTFTQTTSITGTATSVTSSSTSTASSTVSSITTTLTASTTSATRTTTTVTVSTSSTSTLTTSLSTTTSETSTATSTSSTLTTTTMTSSTTSSTRTLTSSFVSSTLTTSTSSVTTSSTSTTYCEHQCIYTCLNVGQPSAWCGDVCGPTCGVTVTSSTATSSYFTSTATSTTTTHSASTSCRWVCMHTCVDVGEPTAWCGDVCGEECETVTSTTMSVTYTSSTTTTFPPCYISCHYPTSDCKGAIENGKTCEAETWVDPCVQQGTLEFGCPDMSSDDVVSARAPIRLGKHWGSSAFWFPAGCGSVHTDKRQGFLTALHGGMDTLCRVCGFGDAKPVDRDIRRGFVRSTVSFGPNTLNGIVNNTVIAHFLVFLVGARFEKLLEGQPLAVVPTGNFSIEGTAVSGECDCPSNAYEAEVAFAVPQGGLQQMRFMVTSVTAEGNELPMGPVTALLEDFWTTTTTTSALTFTSTSATSTSSSTISLTSTSLSSTVSTSISSTSISSISSTTTSTSTTFSATATTTSISSTLTSSTTLTYTSTSTTSNSTEPVPAMLVAVPGETAASMNPLVIVLIVLAIVVVGGICTALLCTGGAAMRRSIVGGPEPELHSIAPVVADEARPPFPTTAALVPVEDEELFSISSEGSRPSLGLHTEFLRASHSEARPTGSALEAFAVRQAASRARISAAKARPTGIQARV